MRTAITLADVHRSGSPPLRPIPMHQTPVHRAGRSASVANVIEMVVQGSTRPRTPAGSPSTPIHHRTPVHQAGSPSIRSSPRFRTPILSPVRGADAIEVVHTTG